MEAEVAEITLEGMQGAFVDSLIRGNKQIKKDMVMVG